MAPLTNDDALRMIRRVKGAQILTGARGRPEGDVEALAECLVNLGRFAVANAGRFRALDLNPIIVRPKARAWSPSISRSSLSQQPRHTAMSYKDLIYECATRSRPSRSTARIA